MLKLCYRVNSVTQNITPNVLQMQPGEVTWPSHTALFSSGSVSATEHLRTSASVYGF